MSWVCTTIIGRGRDESVYFNYTYIWLGICTEGKLGPKQQRSSQAWATAPPSPQSRETGDHGWYRICTAVYGSGAVCWIRIQDSDLECSAVPVGWPEKPAVKTCGAVLAWFVLGDGSGCVHRSVADLEAVCWHLFGFGPDLCKDWQSTRYGPTYGCNKGGEILSLRIKTKSVANYSRERDAGSWVFSSETGRGVFSALVLNVSKNPSKGGSPSVKSCP